jgi:decaprenylphospho-beta-D-ribofuranose 2-oxidase
MYHHVQTEVPDQLHGIESRMELVTSYSALSSKTVRVLKPRTEEELKRIFAHARAECLRVTIRGGGHSFDAQSIGDDLMVSMEHWTRIDEVVPGANTIKVQPGVTWGEILKKLEPAGLVPAITVTTGQATAGGTLAGNCLSRFSPAFGKTGSWVESFDLLTPTGRTLRCAPNCGDPDGEAAFHAVIGGLGWLGVVTSITYRLLSPGQKDGKIGVRTKVYTHRTVENLAHDLVPACKRTVAETSDERDPDKLDAIWSAVFMRGKDKASALLFTSTYDPTPERRRLPIHRPELKIRVLVEWLLRVGWICPLIWRFSTRFIFKDKKEYVDDLDGYTFFMDGNAHAKRLAKKLFGLTLRNVQQTFILPSGPGSAGGWDSAADDLAEWLRYAQEFLDARGLKPTLQDILYVPQEKDAFCLSASVDLSGFAVSYAFETSRRKKIEAAKKALSELSDVLWEEFGGRVYLVKHVFAKQETIAKMYGEHARTFFRLKAQLDPDMTLRNEFLERIFGDLMDDVAGEEFGQADIGHAPEARRLGCV